MITENELIIFRQALRLGIVEFTFIKRDGSRRHAFGTTKENLIREHLAGGDGPEGVISFWDVERGAWRSVRPHTILSIGL